MKVLRGEQIFRVGRHILNIILVAIILFVPIIGIFDGVRANAQTAGQAAEIVKSFSGRTRRSSSG